MQFFFAREEQKEKDRVTLVGNPEAPQVCNQNPSETSVLKRSCFHELCAYNEIDAIGCRGGLQGGRTDVTKASFASHGASKPDTNRSFVSGQSSNRFSRAFRREATRELVRCRSSYVSRLFLQLPFVKGTLGKLRHPIRFCRNSIFILVSRKIAI